jgi:hypothetical protein
MDCTKCPFFLYLSLDYAYLLNDFSWYTIFSNTNINFIKLIQAPPFLGSLLMATRLHACKQSSFLHYSLSTQMIPLFIDFSSLFFTKAEVFYHFSRALAAPPP